MSLRSPAFALPPPDPLATLGESGLGRLVTLAHLGFFVGYRDVTSLARY